jgi:hypothetical protein
MCLHATKVHCMNKFPSKHYKFLYINKYFRKQTVWIIFGAKVKVACEDGETWILKF